MELPYQPVACNRCHCLVHPDELAGHTAWHEGAEAEPAFGDKVAAWLASLDGAELERITLERIGYSDNATQTMLDVLAEWAKAT